MSERRLQTLRDLGRTVIEVKSAEAACQAAAKTLGLNPYDVPFALLYLLDENAETARLIATTGFQDVVSTIPRSHWMSLRNGPF